MTKMTKQTALSVAMSAIETLANTSKDAKNVARLREAKNVLMGIAHEAGREQQEERTLELVLGYHRGLR